MRDPWNSGVRTLRTSRTMRNLMVASVSVSVVRNGRRRCAWTSSTMSPTITETPSKMPARIEMFSVESSK